MSATTKKKHVEREIYEDYSLPSDDLTIVKVLKPRGNNLHQVVNPAGEEFLVSMPPKFRKHLWIKRGDYVVVEDIPEGNKVRGEICRVLMKDHIRYIQVNGKWPKEFDDVDDKNKYDRTMNENEENNKIVIKSVNDNSDSESDSDNDDDLMANPNRQVLYREETESESETESEEENNEPENDG